MYGHRATLYDASRDKTGVGDWGGIPLRTYFINKVEPFEEYYKEKLPLRYWGGPSFVPADDSPNYTTVAVYYDDPDENPDLQLHIDGMVVNTRLKWNASIITSTYDRNNDGIGGRIILFGQHPEDLTWGWDSGHVKEGLEQIYPAYMYVSDIDEQPMEPKKDYRDLIKKAAIWAVIPQIEREQNNPPNEPINPSPENGATGVSINPTLSWQCSDPDNDALTYDVYFGTSSNPPKVATVTSTSYSPGTLQYATTYYWKVVASDGEYESSSQIWRFTTQDNSNNPPYEPTNPSPANGETIYVNDNDDDTDSSNDANNGELQSQQVATSSSAEQLAIKEEDVSALAKEQTTTATPSQPHEQSSSYTLKLSWNGGDPDGDSVTYYVYLAEGDSTPDNLIATTTATTLLYSCNLQVGTTYYWKVVAQDEHGMVTSSQIWHFYVKDSNDSNNKDNGNTGSINSQPLEQQTIA